MDHTQRQEFNYHEEEGAYFEGWYCKTVTKELSLAVIFGISRTENRSYGFIQTNDTIQGSYYEEFAWEELQIQALHSNIRFGNNQLTLTGMVLALRNGLSCDLQFQELVDLKRSWYQPTIMGPFTYAKIMECYHSVISLHHRTSGSILLQNHIYDGSGIGYMEKDRGNSFPSTYLWFQSNHCQHSNSCFFLSVASIPFHGISFTGCICTLMIEGKQKCFATYLGCHVRVLKERNIVIVRQYPYKLLIKLYPNKSHALLAPHQGAMNIRIEESLTSRAEVHVYKQEQQLHRYIFDHGGYEDHLMIIE